MSIYRINSDVGYDSNIYLLTGDRNILIDTGTGIDNKKISSEIKGILCGSSLDMILLTHCHVDHIGGYSKLKSEFGCMGMIGVHDAPAVINADSRLTLDVMFGLQLQPEDVSSLNDGDVIDIGSHRLRVIWTPGHTMGGICLYDEVTKSLFSGDTLFLGGVGRTDFESGSMEMLSDSLKRISNIDIRGLYPGHGSDCTEGGSDYVRDGLRLIGD